MNPARPPRRLMAVHAHPDDVLRAAWPTEEFQLIDSKVESAMPETDLFAGIDTETREAAA